MSEYITDESGEVHGEIVRCRDCENASVQPWNAITRTGLWCVEHDIPIGVDGFCAWGERKWLTCKCGEELESEGRCPSCGRWVHD